MAQNTRFSGATNDGTSASRMSTKQDPIILPRRRSSTANEWSLPEGMTAASEGSRS
jgi:hypothetical protein